MLTPWRFAEGGWKYARKNSTNKYLNHSNKHNIIGLASHIKANAHS